MVPGEPDVAVLVFDQTVRTRLRRLDRIFLELPGLGIEAAELAGELPGVPDGAVACGERIVRPRARRWHLPELDRGVDRPGDDDRGGPRPFGEVLDQVLRERVDLILGHRHLKIEHHADDGVPTLGRVTDAHAVDVVAGAAETDEGLLAGAIGEIRGRLLGARRRGGERRNRGQDGRQVRWHEWSFRHGFSVKECWQADSWNAPARPQAALACARRRKSTNTAAISASLGAQSSGGTRSMSRSPGKRS